MFVTNNFAVFKTIAIIAYTDSWIVKMFDPNKIIAF